MKILGVDKVIGEPWMDGIILGVVKDFFPRSAKEKISPIVMSFRPERTKKLIFRLKDQSKLNDIVQFKSTIDGSTSKQLKYYPSIVEDFYEEDYLLLRIVNGIAVFTIIIGLFGIISMVYFTNIIKSKEYAIRKMFGAKIFDISIMLHKRFGFLFIISSIPALLISKIFITKWLNGFAYKSANSLTLDFMFLLALYTILYLFCCIQLYYFSKINVSNTLKVN